MRDTPGLAPWSGGLEVKIAVEQSPSKIPLLFGLDVIHGHWSTSAGAWVQDAEAFDVWIGADSTATLSASFTVVP